MNKIALAEGLSLLALSVGSGAMAVACEVEYPEDAVSHVFNPASEFTDLRVAMGESAFAISGAALAFCGIIRIQDSRVPQKRS